MPRALLCICLLLAACVDPPRPSVADAAGLRARLGQADVLAVSLLVQLTPTVGEGELFSLRLWRIADGTVRLRAQKLDVDFLDALVKPDGTYEALLIREKVATGGRLGSPEDPPLLSDLRLLIAELRDGPLPRGAVPVGDARAWSWQEDGRTVELDLGVDGLPTAKRIRVDGALQREATYARWQAYEGLQRPSQVRLSLPGEGGTMAVRVKSFDAPPAISAERMALRIPEGVERVDPAEFSRRMP